MLGYQDLRFWNLTTKKMHATNACHSKNSLNQIKINFHSFESIEICVRHGCQLQWNGFFFLENFKENWKFIDWPYKKCWWNEQVRLIKFICSHFKLWTSELKQRKKCSIDFKCLYCYDWRHFEYEKCFKWLERINQSTRND